MLWLQGRRGSRGSLSCGNLTALSSFQPYGFVWEEPLVAANNGGVGDLARCHCRSACMAPSVPFAERRGMPLQLSHGTCAKRSRVLILWSCIQAESCNHNTPTISGPLPSRLKYADPQTQPEYTKPILPTLNFQSFSPSHSIQSTLSSTQTT
jgi:hypothetical protein